MTAPSDPSRPGPAPGAVDLAALVKPLVVPEGFRPPHRLVHGDLVARALSREDLRDDVDGINASVDLIAATRGGGWPTGPVTDEEDYVDLVWHECEMREGYSYAYALYEHDRDYVGCCYLYPVGRRTPLSAELLACDVDVSWWVTTEAFDRGWYPRVEEALRAWLADDLPFTHPHWSNVAPPASDEAPGVAAGDATGAAVDVGPGAGPDGVGDGAGTGGAVEVRAVGVVRSTLADPGDAPCQADEGAPDAWLEFDPAVAPALAGVAAGDEVVVLTWLDRADRSTLAVHPRSDTTRPQLGVFATRSPDRPNPIGLHQVRVTAVDGHRLRVAALEAVDGTPVLDLKPVLGPPGAR